MLYGIERTRFKGYSSMVEWSKYYVLDELVFRIAPQTLGTSTIGSCNGF